MAFDLGDVVPLTIDITDITGHLADAGAVVLTIGLPDGTSVTPSVLNPSTGRYQVDYPTTQAGPHSVRWVATGANASAHTDAFDVRPGTPGYIISLASAKTQLKIPQSDTSQDEQLREFVEATAYVIENHRKEVIVRRTVIEDHFIRESASKLLLRLTPVISLGAVTTVDGGTSWNVADLHVTSATGLVVGKSSMGTVSFIGNIQVTYVAGRTIIPANYTLAARIIVQHLWETTRGNPRTGPWPGGQEDTTQIFGMGFAIPNRALQLLGKPPPLVG